MLGYGASGNYSHEYIDDDVPEEKDVDNDETFGADVVPDIDWEIEDLAQQTEIIEETYKRNGAEISSFDVSITPACQHLEAQGAYTNYQAFAMESIEKSLYDLVEDDDEPSVSSPIVKAKSDFNGSSIMSNNSSVASFYDFCPELQSKSTKNIWAHHHQNHNAVPMKHHIDLANLPPLIPEKATGFQPSQSSCNESKNSLNLLLSKLSATNPNLASSGVTSTGSETKMVKTLEEIEAELLAMTKEASSCEHDKSPNSAVEDVEPESSNNLQMKIPTSLAQPLLAAAMELPLRQPLPSLANILTPEVVAACATNPALLNAVYAQLLAAIAANSQQQQLVNMATVTAGSTPPFPPQSINPQTRTLLIGALAPRKLLPPSLMQPPLVAPIGQPKLNFPAPPGFPLLSNTPVIDPRILLAAKSGLIRPPPDSPVTSPLIKVKPIVPLQSTSVVGSTFRNRRENENVEDEYAGLMTKRERGYMVNIQCIQVHTDDPYNDDYYWVMYKKRRLESINDAKDSVNGVLSDLRDIHKDFEHRAYVPPDFQGSLGKLQSSSIACPRHLIDLRQNTTENDKFESRESPSVVETGAADHSKLISLSKVNTSLLLDIENAYVEALKCDQYLVELKGYNQCELSDRIRENLGKIVWCTKNVISLIATDSCKLQCVLSSRKGRRLVNKILPFLQNYELTLILNLFIESLFRKTNALSDEVYSFFVRSLNETLDSSSELNWTELLNKLLSNYSLINRTSINFRADCLLFILFFHCSLQNAKLSDNVQSQLAGHLQSFSSKIQLNERQLFALYVRKFVTDLDIKLNSLGSYFRSGGLEMLVSFGNILTDIFA